MMTNKYYSRLPLIFVLSKEREDDNDKKISTKLLRILGIIANLDASPSDTSENYLQARRWKRFWRINKKNSNFDSTLFTRSLT